MRIVLDTNIFVSALIQSRGHSATLVSAWLEAEFALVTSNAQLDELRRVVSRPRLEKWITRKECDKLLDSIPVEAILVEPVQVQISPDPDDDVILGTAIAGNANLIVTGDKSHLLALKNVAGIPIVSAREACQQIIN